MSFWDILVYFSIAVCYFSALTVIIGWIKHARNK
ncbi:hypothetical protein X953_16185 [Virgibacillus sp. SK37]|nr:hypothetical protein X953_16185 [Virgibacillus sp. SK37]